MDDALELLAGDAVEVPAEWLDQDWERQVERLLHMPPSTLPLVLTAQGAQEEDEVSLGKRLLPVVDFALRHFIEAARTPHHGRSRRVTARDGPVVSTTCENNQYLEHSPSITRWNGATCSGLVPCSRHPATRECRSCLDASRCITCTHLLVFAASSVRLVNIAVATVGLSR